MLWFDLTHLLNEPQERAAPEIHITIDYTVRAFEETEKEYLELYSFFTHWKKINISGFWHEYAKTPRRIVVCEQ